MKGHRTVFLLVDDDPLDRDVLQRELKKEGLMLSAVSNGAEAVDYLLGQGRFRSRRQYLLPDVILLDLKMPRMDGFEFLEWKKSGPDNVCAIPVVVLSSSNEQEDIDKAYRLGANAYLFKPLNYEAFKQRMIAVGVYWAELTEKPHVDL